MPLAVRSAGHGISGRSTNDGGVLLDLGALDAVRLPDDGSRRVRLGAGATWGQVAEALSPHGLAISSGTRVVSVSVAWPRRAGSG
ncbi:FAD-binding protein [Oerskovia sp. M15]